MAVGSSGSIVERVELREHAASERSTWTVVCVTARCGVTGIGECSDSGRPDIVAAAVDAARSAFSGRPVAERRDALREWLLRQRADAEPAAALAWSTALGGIESALEDLSARIAGVSLADRLGTTPPDRVALYANLNRASGHRGTETLVDAARAAAAAGFPAVKIAPFDRPPSGPAPDDVVGSGLQIIDAVRSAVPDRTELMIDCHFRLDDDALQTVLPELAARRIYWLEDAVRPDRVDRLRWLRERTDLALACGEHEWDPAVVAAGCGSGAVDFWLIDPKHAGGPRATARLLERTGETAVSFHNPSGPIGTVHAALLCRLSTRVTWLEYVPGEPDRAGYLSPAEKVEDGALVVPVGPGIGAGLADDRADGGVPR